MNILLDVDKLAELSWQKSVFDGNAGYTANNGIHSLHVSRHPNKDMYRFAVCKYERVILNNETVDNDQQVGADMYFAAEASIEQRRLVALEEFLDQFGIPGYKWGGVV